MVKPITREEVKEVLMNLCLEKERAVSYYEVIEFIEETPYYDEFEELIEEIGDELEAKGYELEWQYTKKDDANAVRFYIVK